MDFYSPNAPIASGVSAGGKHLLAPAPIMEASALLTRRIHHQKQLISKAKAEARRNSAISLMIPDQSANDSSPRTPENKVTESMSSHRYSLTTPEHRSVRSIASVGRPNGSADSDTLKFGTLGMREQTEIISQKSKENFGLKLMLTKSREQALRCEKELKKVRQKLDRAQARNEELEARNVELERENEDLRGTIQGRDIILDAAAKEIAECQDKLAGFNEREDALEARKDEREFSGMASANINSETTLVSGNPPSSGTSPYVSHDSLTSFGTPMYRDEATEYSPCTSNALGMIDFNTPCSVMSSSFAGTSPLSIRTPVRHSRNGFIERCESALSESPALEQSPIGGSSPASLPSIISESCLSMYGGNGDNGDVPDTNIFYDQISGPYNENGGDRLNIKRWGRHGQSDVDTSAQTPIRNSGTTRRSPRMEIMEFRDKQDKRKSQDIMQNMPPTPESMSPRRRIAGSFVMVLSKDDVNEDSFGLGLMSLTEDTDDSKTDTYENNNHSTHESVEMIQSSDVEEPSTLQKGVREIADRLRSPFKFSGGSSVAQKDPQSFSNVTRERETKKRLGYGFGTKPGGISGASKQPGRDTIGHSRKLSVNKDSKDKLVTVPVKPVTTNLPVRSRIRQSTQQPAQGLETPPYTPNSDFATSHDSEKTTLIPRSLKKKSSWESAGSNSNTDSDGASRPAYNSHHTIGHDPSHLRRKSAATLAATDNTSAMASKTVKRLSGIPALVRAGSVGEKSRRR